jgi:uncharacterized radical SAM superfamily Fe-S cluster-containing enzyme
VSLIHETTSLCRECLCALPAQVVAREDQSVWIHKTCPTHGAQEARLSDDAGWYEATRAELPVPAPPPSLRPVELGCPYDCGPCEHHEQKVRLPVVTITSQCDLNCPICYVHNKNEDAFHMSDEEFGRLLDHLHKNADGDLDLINFTGGEPTLHPRWLELMKMALDSGVHRVSICSHGIRLVKDESLVERLATIGGRVALSFDSFDSDPDFAINGARLVDLKMRCLDLLEKHDVETTLIPVLTKGVNDHEVGRIIELMLERPNIRHCEVHTITYSGQGGETYDRSARISMHEVLTRIEQTTKGLLRETDFVPSPCAHPLCYQIAYLLLDPEGGPPVPYLRFLTRQEMIACLADHLYLEPSATLERALQAAINRLWSEGGEDSERVLRLLSGLLRRMFPPGKSISRAEALRVGELASKAVYVHSHMDAETFDVERAMQCCDSNCYADGTTVPICNTNVLFKGTEPRFNAAPRAWGERSGGRKDALPQVGRLLPVIGGGAAK